MMNLGDHNLGPQSSLGIRPQQVSEESQIKMQKTERRFIHCRHVGKGSKVIRRFPKSFFGS